MPVSEGMDKDSREGHRLVSLLDEVIDLMEHRGKTNPSQKLSLLIQEVISLWEKAETEEKRVNLLNLFDLAHRMLLPVLVDPDTKKRVEEAQSRIYNSFIVSECLIGTNVSVERLDRITGREITANKMAEGHSLRATAIQGISAPHLSEDELLKMAATEGQ